jgi:tRNA-dihydrouridine synthase B
MMKIGKLQLQSNLLLSPMEGVSDAGFRRLCFNNGAAITWTEMVRAAGIVRRNKATLDLIDTHDPQTLTGVQLFVVNERELAVALYTIEQLAASSHPHFANIRAVDLNFGCPSPEIIRLGAGPALLKRQAKLTTIFDKLRHWKENTSLDIGAVGAKIRLGLNQMEQDHKIYLRVAQAAQQHLDYLIVHARHAKQRSSDVPSWNAIREVKEEISIPVIGNGDVVDKASTERMLEQTKCDGIMIARAAIRNPWIFREIAGAEPPSRAEIEAAMLQYEELAERFQAKEKYRLFHRQNFERMLRGDQLSIPKNTHI